MEVVETYAGAPVDVVERSRKITIYPDGGDSHTEFQLVFEDQEQVVGTRL